MKPDGGKQRRNVQQLGGKGLSLESFANAKSRSSGYNPALIKKQREFYKNAKIVSKYRKSVKQHYKVRDHIPATTYQEDNTAEKIHRPTKKPKLPSLNEVYEMTRAEKERIKMEKEAAIQAKKEAKERSEAKRKDLKEKMTKKTRFGQPVMKFRIQHLLETALKTSEK